MSKFNLTIECADVAELGRIVSLLGGTTAIVSVAAAAAPAAAPVAAQPAAAPAFAPVAVQPGTTDPNAERDSKGLPWDARIHSETKARNKDGSWRGRRGVDEATITAVEAELRAHAPVTQEQPRTEAFQPAAAPTPAQVFGQPPGAAAPAFAPAAAPAFAPAAQPAPVRDYAAEAAAAAAQDKPGEMPGLPAFMVAQPQQPAAAPVAQQPAPAPVAAAPAAPAAPVAPMTFQQLMGAIASGLRDKKIDNNYLGQLVEHFQLGAAGLPSLANVNAHLIPAVVDSLRLAGVVA